MKRLKNISHLSICCVFLLGCVDAFEVPPSISNDGILVVEGRMGNDETIISLSRTANLDSFSIKPEVNAILHIENEVGSIGQLNEREAGTYFLDTDLNFGEKYRIRIETASQEVYHSDYATLLETPPITALEYEVDTAEFGVEILLSTEDPNNDTGYYLWDYNETYEYFTKFKSLLEFDGVNLTKRNKENQIKFCWKTDYSSDILLQSSIQLEEDVVSKKPIVRYTLTETRKFVIAYSILVNQYAVSAEEFEFWSLLETNSESLGTLFDPQPAQITSNLQCTSHPQKRVIGYIGCSSKTQKRLFVDGRDLPRDPTNLILYCTERSVLLSEQEELIEILSSGRYVPTRYAPIGDSEGLFYAANFCADCRVQGGTNVKPDYWF
ncbi:MAG: DUF4249 domain-containing protein [Ekhidna sp.]